MNLKWLGLIILGASVFTFSYSYNKRLLDWLRFQSLGTRDYIVDRLKDMFIELPPNKALAYMLAISFGPGAIVFLACLPNLLPGFLLGAVLAVIGWKAPKPIIDFIYAKRCERFVLQMVDALSLMSNGMRSGLSMVQAMGLVTQEMNNPIRQEFGLVLSQNKLGVSIEEAFTNLSKRIKSDDVEMFVTSVNILKETGGNLAETFDTIVTTIRERIKVENKIASMTAQGLYQGIFVMTIPPIMCVIFYQTDPDYMRPLFVTPLGWLILAGIVILEVVGYLVIRKVIKIDV